MKQTEEITDEQERRAQLLAGTEKFRLEMEVLASKIRDLVLTQAPVQLLGYLLAQFHMANMFSADEDQRPDKKVNQKFQLALEYVHAIWSCHADLADESTPLAEAVAAELFETLDQLEAATMMYCMASSAPDLNSDHGRQSAETEFHAKSTWALIRGHRYQVLEREFFAYVLEPHADALRQAYGMEPDAIADGIQNIADAFRAGFSNAAERMFSRMEQAYELVEETGDDLETVLKRLQSDETGYAAEMSGNLRDMFFGGVCNLSRHSSLSEPILEDLSYLPGENDKFYAAGEFTGTPMRTLPARVKPGIKLGAEFYATDGQFIRDSAYRAIQWGLWKRLPYRDEWLKRQALVVEQAYPRIFTSQLDGSKVHSGVYYRDVQTDDWVETDLLILLEDVLFVIEAKAGAMPMHSPATNFTSHVRVIQDLIVKAYRQCRRFLDYLASQPEVPIFNLVDGSYVEVARLRRDTFRRIFPIGLTVESFTPFSAMAKELAEVQPILGNYPFISMSLDDLFVLNRFLPTTGQLTHYLDVRQKVAGLPNALLFDETDHLGAYIQKNRFDEDIRAQLKQADRVTWDSFSDIVDRYFEGPYWEVKPVPTQDFPEPFDRIFSALDRFRPAGWLSMDARLRDYGGEGRDNLARFVTELEPTLAEHPRRRFQLGEEDPVQVWLCRMGAFPSQQEMQYQAEAGCLVVGAAKMDVLVLAYESEGQITGAACATYRRPSILRRDYAELQAEAQRQRRRMKVLSKAQKRKKKRNTKVILPPGKR